MEHKKELKQQYKEIPVEAGIYQIKNTKNGKSFIASTKNLKTLNGVKFMLDMGSHMNKVLQKDWLEYGKDVFEIEILEILKKKEVGYFNEKEELRKLEEKWFDQIQPYGENGYHTKK